MVPQVRRRGSSDQTLANLFTNEAPIKSYLGTGGHIFDLLTHPRIHCCMPPGKAFITLARRQLPIADSRYSLGLAFGLPLVNSQALKCVLDRSRGANRVRRTCLRVLLPDRARQAYER